MKPRLDPEAAWETRRMALEQLDRFTLQARVSSGGVLGARGNLNWRQRAGDFDMRVSGPFGIGAVAIAGTPENVEIRTPRKVYHTGDPESFLHDKLGWTFPVGGLRYWALGLPSPHAEAEIELDDDGRVVAMQQDDWSVEYDEYQQVGRYALPKRFEIANKEVTIRVVVDDWRDLPER